MNAWSGQSRSYPPTDIRKRMLEGFVLKAERRGKVDRTQMLATEQRREKLPSWARASDSTQVFAGVRSRLQDGSLLWIKCGSLLCVPDTGSTYEIRATTQQRQRS